MVYITTNFIIGSIANALNVLLAETVFVDGRNVPGGALAALAIYDHLVITQVCFAFYMINSWTQDGLLVSTQLAKSRLSHRMFRTALSFLYNFWSTVNYRRHTFMSVYGLYQWVDRQTITSWWLSLLFAQVFSCLLLWQLTVPTAGFFAHTSVNFGTVFWSMSIGTTVLLTTLIVLRLLYMKIRTYKTLKQQDSTPYLSLSATLIESASLYSIIGLLFLVFYNKGSATQNLFLSFLGQVEVCSFFRSWKKEVFNAVYDYL